MFGWGKKRGGKSANVAPETTTPAIALRAVTLNENSPDEITLDESKLRCVIGLHSDVGCVREGNEDNARAIFPDSDGERMQRGVLVVVADGMGGHASGEIASEIAVDTVCREYFSPAPEYSDAPSAVLRAALENANAAIYHTARRDKSKRGMGTTCTALVLRGDRAFAAHAGDSRLYLLRDGAIYQLSEDHSAVMEMVRQGMLTAQQARHHANKNLITRALGLHPTVEVDVWDEALPVRAGDRFLLCSDGLTDLLEDDDIRTQTLGANPQAACEALVEQAKIRGGHDNITVAIVHVRGRSDVEESSLDELPVTREVAQPAEAVGGEAVS